MVMQWSGNKEIDIADLKEKILKDLDILKSSFEDMTISEIEERIKEINSSRDKSIPLLGLCHFHLEGDGKSINDPVMAYAYYDIHVKTSMFI